MKFAKLFAVGEFDVTKDEFAPFVRETGYDGGSESRSGRGTVVEVILGVGTPAGCWIVTKDGKSGEMAAGRSWRDPGFPQTGSHPVACVNWKDATAYVEWLSKKTGQPYRLLSKSEWEYAARAGTTTAYFWGDAVGKDNAICDGCGSWWDNKGTSPVGTFAPNAFGLYEMHGNVWQWVQDCYHDSYAGAPGDGSPVVSRECSLRTLRGGSWHYFPRYLRAASRRWNMPPSRDNTLGFRVARTLFP